MSFARDKEMQSTTKGFYDKSESDSADSDQEDENEDEDENEGLGSSDEDITEATLSTSHKKRPLNSKSKSAKKSRYEKPKGQVSRFFDDEARDNEDSEEEEESKQVPGEAILDEDELLAIDAVELRHKKNREFLNADAAKIAERYQNKAREDRANRYSDIGQPLMQGRVGTVLQQSLLPSIADPSIWSFKVAPGKESLLVMSVMRKAIDSRVKGGSLRIKSVFCGSSKGCIYVEAIAELFAREAVSGLRGIYQSSMKKVAVQEMTAVLNVTVTKKPLVVNQWARVSRGPLKGDLVRITAIFEGGSKVMIQAVPRPDYTATTVATSSSGPSGGAKANPPQRLFESAQVVKAGGEFFRKYHPDDRSGGHYEFWGNEYYKDGFLYKTVNPSTYLHVNNVKPKIEEQKLFLFSKPKKGDDGWNGDNDEDDEEDENDRTISRSLLTEMAGQLQAGHEEESTKLKASPFAVGDLVQVTGGELLNLVGRVVSTSEITRSVRVTPVSSSTLTDDFTIETALLVKYITPGAHVKVISGQYIGQTGRVVAVNAIEGRPVATIFTDGINTEIQCDVANLQVSSEVTTGLGNLMGYELYDLVALNENECAVVIMVGAQRLRVINHLDKVKDIHPQELQGKRNGQSSRSSGFDKQQNSIMVGNVVNVEDGPHAKRTGTIKQFMKGTLWLHSASYLKNSGIFVVRGRQCTVAGIKSSSSSLSVIGAMPPPSASAPIGTKVSAISRPNSKVAKDSAIGQTISIKKGPYKGMLGQVVDATAERFSIELLAKMKKVTIERSNVTLVGTKEGRKEQSTSDSYSYPSESYFTSETPRHSAMNETPNHAFGSQTPLHQYGDSTPLGSRTPGRIDDVWNVNSRDGVQSPWGVDPKVSESGEYGGVASHESAPRHISSSHGSPSSSPWTVGDNSHTSAGQFGNSYEPYGQLSSRSSSNGNSGGAYSPHAASHESGPSSSDGAVFRDWVSEMIVVFKSGTYTGKQAVLRCKPDEFGKFKVSFRDGATGRLVGGSFETDYRDVTPCEPTKKAKVLILSGPHQGKSGIVKGIANRDLVVSLNGSDGDPIVVKAASTLWIN